MNSVGTRVGIEFSGGRWEGMVGGGYEALLNSAAAHIASLLSLLLLTLPLLSLLLLTLPLLTPYSTPFLWLSTIYRARC